MQKKKGSALETIEGMESLFEFGGGIAPFLEELFSFLGDLMPILAKATRAIENSHSAMPAATDNITSATTLAEEATQSIMDQIEKMSSQIEEILANKPDDALQSSLQDVAGKIVEIQTALQFQDITSQHLKQATQIVEAIQSRSQKMIHALDGIAEKNDLVKSILDKYAREIEVEDQVDTTDEIHMDDSISQADIDSLFGS